jgi:sterol desaturase/sphingolipid hydroxylase (fatty acid hydroxylase superfamily)
MAKGGLILFENRILETLSRYPWWYIWVMWPPLCLWQLYHGFFQSAAATHLVQVAAAAAGALNAGDVIGAATATTASFLYSNTTAQAMAAGVASAPWFPRAVLESTADSLTFATMPQALIRATIWNLSTTFLLGMFAWTIFEYFFHRCVFHMESHGNFGNGFHYFMHGIHHLTPTDSTRLTFPALFVGGIAYGVHVLMRETIPLVAKASTCPFQAVFAGFLFAYTLYDTAHFFFHHSDFDNRLFRRLKTAHLNHHYKNEEMNFGVTSPLWDHVFGTWDPLTGKDRAGSGKKRAASKKVQ